jgi:hypothetical protein
MSKQISGILRAYISPLVLIQANETKIDQCLTPKAPNFKARKTSRISEAVTPLHLLTMPSSSVVPQAVDRTAADEAYAELVRFVDSRSPGVVDKQLDTVQDFDGYLKTPDLRKANALVADFLDVCCALEITLSASSQFISSN